MVGDVSKVTVRPGQSLSEIASQMSPQLGGVEMDEALLALYKANPDAFIGGSVHRLKAGAQLNKPDATLLGSITPAQAKEFAQEANRRWLEKQDQADPSNSRSPTPKPVSQGSIATGEDRLRIGPAARDEADTRRYVEDIVAQEKALAQSKARVAELEKNIADLQKLLEARKDGASSTKTMANPSIMDQWGPAMLGIGLIGITALLLWSLARYTRRAESEGTIAPETTPSSIPPQAAAIFSTLDLNLGSSTQQDTNALRVKLNLAKAYITIEDFVAARKTLEEILLVSNQIDPQITITARSLMTEMNQRSDR